MTDAELIARARAGDTAAFGQLVTRHQHLVVAVALAITRDRGRAEDAAQEAFVAAWRGLASLKEEAKVRSWIAGIARHRALDLLRGKSRPAHPPFEGGSYHDPPTTDPSPLDHLLDAEEHELVAGALAALPDAQRETVILHYFEGRSVRAVATALAVSEDTVKQRLHRARETLRDRVADRLGTALEHARPSAAFATGVLAAIGVTSAAGTASATVLTQGALVTTKQVVFGLGALVLASGAAFVALRKPAPVAASAPQPAPEAERAPDPVRSPSAPTPAPPAPPRKLDPAARARLVDAIRTARTRRLAALPRPSSPSAPLSGASLTGSDDRDADKDVIRASVQEILPLIQECYESALERNPKLSGTLVVRFTIEGEPEVGGLIGESAIDPDTSTLLDADTHECVRESMYALELPPPTGGGIVNVTYPFEFRAAATDDDGDGDGDARRPAAPTPPPAR